VTVAKWWNGSAWVPVGVQGPAGQPRVVQDEGVALPARGAVNFTGKGVVATDNPASDRTDVSIAAGMLTAQRLEGQNANYVAIASGGAFAVAVGVPLALTLTPSVDCWWETTFHIGILQKLDAAYHYGYLGVSLTPDDADGVNASNGLFTQRSDVDTYGYREFTRLWKLIGGTTYTAAAAFSTNGGSWQYNQGPSYIWAHGKAWAR
jgi:hypothetical protein